MASSEPRRGAIIVGINVTPLVDITLVLLVIFMVTAKIALTPALPLDLPVASHAEALPGALTLVIPARGSLSLDGEALDEAALESRLRAKLARDPTLRAIIEAERSVPHGRVMRVLDALQAAGLTRVAFGAAPGAGDDDTAPPVEEPHGGAQR